MNSPYLPLWWGWAPGCCRRTAGQPLRSASSWWRARMGWALNRFDYIPEADVVQTPDLLMGPLMFLEPVSCSLSPRIHPTPCWCLLLFFLPLSYSPTPFLHLPSLPKSAVPSASRLVSPHVQFGNCCNWPTSHIHQTPSQFGCLHWAERLVCKVICSVKFYTFSEFICENPVWISFLYRWGISHPLQSA